MRCDRLFRTRARRERNGQRGAVLVFYPWILIAFATLLMGGAAIGVWTVGRHSAQRSADAAAINMVEIVRKYGHNFPATFPDTLGYMNFNPAAVPDMNVDPVNWV